MNKTLLAMLLPFLNLMTMHAADPGTGGGASDEDGGEPGDGGEEGDKSGQGDPGGKKPTDEEARLLKEVMDKKNKLIKQGEQIAALQNQLKSFEGIDPVAVKTLLDKQKADEENRLKAAGEFDKLTQQMANAHAAEIERVRSEASTFQTELANAKKQIVELTIGNSFGTSKYLTEDTLLTPAKARKLYAEHFELSPEGVLTAYDRPASDANKAPLVDASGIPLSFDAAIQKIIDADPDRDTLLKSKLKPGANSKTDQGGGKGAGQGKQDQKLTGREKITAGLAQALKAASKQQ